MMNVYNVTLNLLVWRLWKNSKIDFQIQKFPFRIGSFTFHEILNGKYVQIESREGSQSIHLSTPI